MTDAEAERTPLLGVADIPPGGRTVATRWVERRPERPTGTARLLRRAGGVLGQSPGKWDIEHKWGEKSSCCAWMDRVETVWDAGRRLLYRSDPFHTVVNLSTWKILAIVVGAYMAIFSAFGLMYWVMGKWPAVFGNCGLVHQNGAGENTHTAMTFWDALFFSVETQATIGYSSPSDIFFDDCPLVLVAITAQSVSGLFLDAALLGLLFNRLARGSPRANTILFSDRACVRKIRGRYHLMIQLRIDTCPILAASSFLTYWVSDVDVGMACAAVATGNVAYYQPFAMRLQHPDDELGGMLLLNLPNIVVHTMDNWSPLVPHPMDLRLWRAPSSSPRVSRESDDDVDIDDDWNTEEESSDGDGRVKLGQHRHDPMSQCRFPDVLQRVSDCENGSRDSVMCTTCGETFPHERALRKHMRYNCTGDEISGWDMSLMCSVCGETFPSRTALQLHTKSSASCKEARTVAEATLEVNSDAEATVLASSQEQRDDESARYRRNRHHDTRRIGQDGVRAASHDPSKTTNSSESGADFEHEACRSRTLIEEWLEATQAEIIVLVEGIDATTSYTVQARHSYTWQELAWDCTFAQTVFPSERPPAINADAGGGQIPQHGCMIDFTKFNDLVPVRSDGRTSPRDLSPSPLQPQQQRYGEIQ